MLFNSLSICVLVLVLGKSSLAAEIRCYCNSPECEATNSTCTVNDEEGACFSDFMDYTEITKVKQGCIEDKMKQEKCGNAPGSSGAPKSLLLCCLVDMCNQMAPSYIEGLLNHENRQYNRGYNSHEVWFKAATIAVPICGAMILVLLVTLACKILRSDHVNVDKFCQDGSNASTQLNQYSQDAAKKVPLLHESRHNCEDFRYITTTRIHYGQNVNVLKEPSDKPEKNVNLEIAREQAVVVEVENEVDSSAPTTSRATLDVRVEPALNLEKSENVNSCNLYLSPSNTEIVPAADKCFKYGSKSFV